MKANKIFHFVLVVIFLTSLLAIHPQLRAAGAPHESEAQINTTFSDQWNFSCVDCPPMIKAFNDRSMRLDANGYPHIAYGQDHLYYAWYDGAAWHTQTIDNSTRVGSGASLMLDSSGYARISYIDEYLRILKYAYQDASGWHIITVDPGGEEFFVSSWGNYEEYTTSLAVDKSGYSHIAYVENDALSYAWQDASGWHYKFVSAGWYSAKQVYLVLDANNYPHIAYVDAYNSYFSVEYIYLDSTGWQQEDVDTKHGWIGGTTLVLDNNGIPSISYTFYDDYYTDGVNSYGIVYAVRGGAEWNKQIIEEIVTADDYGIGSPSLRFDQSGKPHIAYFLGYPTAPGTGMKYASWDGSTWQIQLISKDGGVASLAFDSSGKPALAYMGGGKLKFATLIDSTWQIQEVDESRSAGSRNSLALTPNGYAKIAYISVGMLKLATQTANGWDKLDIDSSHINTWGGVSMALDGNSYPHISYFESFRDPSFGMSNKLKFAYQDAAGWTISTLDRIGDAEPASSLAVDSQGYVHIFYTSSKGLLFAHQSASGWFTSTVSSRGAFGGIALDMNDNPHFVYGSKVAILDGNGWRFLDMNPPSPVYSPSIVVDSGGFEHISYLTTDQNGIYKYMYAWRDNAGWHHETVSSNSNNYDGLSSRLTLDPNGKAHIAYHDFNYSDNHDLHYAYRDVSGWYTDTIDALGNVGESPSLALTLDGKPHISYYDASNGDLKFAYLGGLPKPGVILSPASQAKGMGLSHTVQYQERIYNFTGKSETFTLNLGAHNWPAALSTYSIGPLPNGISAGFTVTVTVPANAALNSIEALKVYAASVSTTTYTATTSLATQAFPWPHIMLDKDSLTSKVQIGGQKSHQIMISNGAGNALTYQITDTIPTPNAFTASWLSVAPAQGTVPSGGSISINVLVNTSALKSGSYTTTLYILTNDPATPVMQVRVSVEVLPIKIYLPTLIHK